MRTRSVEKPENSEFRIHTFQRAEIMELETYIRGKKLR